mgnify:CR=1 FL=1
MNNNGKSNKSLCRKCSSLSFQILWEHVRLLCGVPGQRPYACAHNSLLQWQHRPALHWQQNHAAPLESRYDSLLRLGVFKISKWLVRLTVQCAFEKFDLKLMSAVQCVSIDLFVLTVMQYWEISSKTCKHLPADQQEVYDPATQTMTVQVGLPCSIIIIHQYTYTCLIIHWPPYLSVQICDTYSVDESITTPGAGPARRRRAAPSSPTYFSQATMFIVSTTAASIYNSPPRLNVSQNVYIVEDSGQLQYCQLGRLSLS